MPATERNWLRPNVKLENQFRYPVREARIVIPSPPGAVPVNWGQDLEALNPGTLLLEVGALTQRPNFQANVLEIYTAIVSS